MKKVLTISAAVFAVLCLLAVMPTNSFANSLEFNKINFFEKGSGELAYNQRVYRTEFPQSQARYINTELNFKNLLYGVRNHSHTVNFRYYKPDGSLFWENTTNMTVESGWYTVWHNHGCGWKTPGNWQVGTYTVKVWMDGSFLSQAYFTVYDDVVHLQFQELKFYESGYDSIPLEQQQYRTQFPKSTTRYVNFMVESKNLLYGIRDQSPLIIGKYYREDGSLFGESRLELPVPSNWETVYSWRGQGWRNPGNWTPGRYRVDIYFGEKYVGQGWFTITP